MTIRFRAKLEEFEQRMAVVTFWSGHGEVIAVHDNVVVSTPIDASLGSLVSLRGHALEIPAEIIALEKDHSKLMPLRDPSGLRIGDAVKCYIDQALPLANRDFSGRCVDALGSPIDGRGDLLFEPKPAIMSKDSVTKKRLQTTKITTGFICFDHFLPIGRGQKIGVFSPAGCGKTTLLNSLIDITDFDHCVIALIGERGREVSKTWASVQAKDNSDQYTMVACTSDELPTRRVRALDKALRICEARRYSGEDVLLIVDSLSRYALALREVGLAAGAPPTVRAYTPNVFTEIPKILERCGAFENAGSITGVFSVLTDDEMTDDPLSEMLKSILDGHIVLSRSLANRGHYPAIDFLRSISRFSAELLSDNEKKISESVMGALSRVEDAKAMIESGLYKSGDNPELDQAQKVVKALFANTRQLSRSNSDNETGFHKIMEALS